MKKIFSLLFCLLCFGYMAKSQEATGDSTQAPVVLFTSADLQGLWTLSALEGNDMVLALTPEQIQASTDNYLHDYPLGSTTLNFSGAGFTLVHHVVASMDGTFEIAPDNVIVLTSPPACSECGPKVLYFRGQSYSANELVVIELSEDGESTEYVRLTFTR